MKLIDMSQSELSKMKQECEEKYNNFKAQNLKLDMSRGKPSSQQLDISMDMMNILTGDAEEFKAKNGLDCRNYGMLDGIPEAKELFGKMIGVNTDEIIVYGNSSLNIMYNAISTAMTHGIMNSKPWCKYDKVKFLCPVPGYDRHFAICEFFGIEMINIPMNCSGPDVDMIEKLVSEDDTIKGIWCVPQYSNPDGIVYSDEVVKRLANLNPKAEDFRIFWDNAYCIHHLVDNPKQVLNILDECKKNGKEDIVYIFGSTSKVSFSGAGVAVMGASKANIASIKKQLTISTISYDKINQLRHVKYFKTIEGMNEHMKKHRDIILPKFNAVLEILNSEIAQLGIGSWIRPDGGYFVSFNAMNGCAKRIVELCKDAGVVLTPAGAAFPYGKDPDDKNIRIAPTYPPIDELNKAMELFCVCVKIASIEKIMGE